MIIEHIVIGTILIVFITGVAKSVEFIFDILFNIADKKREKKVLDLFEINNKQFTNIKLFKKYDVYYIHLNDEIYDISYTNLIHAKTCYNKICLDYLRSITKLEEIN